MSDVTIAAAESDEAPAASAGRTERDRPPSIDEQLAWRLGTGIALPTVVIGLFLVGAWSVERFREAIGVLAEYVPGALYAAVGGLLLGAAAHRLLAARLVTRKSFRSPSLQLLTRPLAVSGAVVAYLVPIVDKWENGRGGYSAIGGVIPWRDADGYYSGAVRLLFDGYLDSWSSRRPLNGAFLADRLAMTNLDLRLALVIQAILLGAACYIAARTVAQDFGPIAGLALFAGMYSFASFGVETTLSESLAVTLGALAFAALWNALRDRRVWLCAAGLFLLAVALAARPGTVVILLVLPVLFALYFRGQKLINLRVLGLGAAVIVAAVAMNVFVAVTLKGTPSTLNASFYPTLYGLAKGNEEWRVVYTDYPQLDHMSAPEAAKFIRGKAIDEIRQHPGTFVKGLARSTGDYLQQTRDKITGPVEQAPVRRMLYAAAVLGAALAVGLRWRTSRWRVLLDLALFAGVVLAVPVLFGLWLSDNHIGQWLPLAYVVGGYVAFVVLGTARVKSPAWEFALVSLAGIALSLSLTTIRDIGPRVYAATVPFFALFFAGAVAIIARFIRGAPTATPPLAKRSRLRSWVPVAVGATIVAITVFATPLATATVSKPEVRSRTCPDGRRAVAFTGGVAVHLVPNKPNAESELDDIDLAQFSPDSLEIAGLLQGLPPGVTILQALPVGRHPELVLTVVDGYVDPPGRSVLYLCGRTRVADPEGVLPVFFGTPLRS